jgi:ppGpp synthetase/RelA/SpoT-type nucleotidyltranferase
LLVYEAELERAVLRVRSELDVLPTSRVKNTSTILEKLRRHGGSWLKSIQDVAGMRIVDSLDRNGQDALVAEIVTLFGGERRRPRVVDRRARPMHGYTAVHVVAYPADIPVEIQVRTRWQHEWADLYEKLADRVGRGIRYGEPPAPSAQFELHAAIVDHAQAVSTMIQSGERAEQVLETDSDGTDFRQAVEDQLTSLRDSLERLTAMENDTGSTIDL